MQARGRDSRDSVFPQLKAPNLDDTRMKRGEKDICKGCSFWIMKTVTQGMYEEIAGSRGPAVGGVLHRQ